MLQKFETLIRGAELCIDFSERNTYLGEAPHLAKIMIGDGSICFQMEHVTESKFRLSPEKTAQLGLGENKKAVVDVQPIDEKGCLSVNIADRITYKLVDSPLADSYMLGIKSDINRGDLKADNIEAPTVRAVEYLRWNPHKEEYEPFSFPVFSADDAGKFLSIDVTGNIIAVELP